MKLADHSPPSTPTPDQQLDALKMGLGRAAQWAKVGLLDDGPLLAACVHDLRYDQDLDDLRASWLWSLVEQVGAVDRFRGPILDAFNGLAGDRDAEQLCTFARRYAEAGDDAFRARIYALAEAEDDGGWRLDDGLARANLLWLDGEAGFLRGVRIWARQLAGREWEHNDGYIHWIATERLGEARVVELLGDPGDPDFFAYREGLERYRRAEAEEKQARAARRQATVDEILSAAGGIVAKFFHFSTWGRRATDDDLEPVFRRLIETREPFEVLNLLALFSRRAFPRFDPRLVELCRDPDAEVRRRAIQALALLADPGVRQFALEELRAGRVEAVIFLFVENYEPGDERRVLDAIEPPADAEDRHLLLSGVIEVLEANPGADRLALGVMAYARTPCEFCRWKTVKLLHAPKVIAPTWLTEECRSDSHDTTRRYADLTTRFRIK